MTNKFVIWTVQRTGSTSLANILTLLSGEVVHHEPFNSDRFLAYDGEQDKLAERLAELEEKKLNFKHCWNVHPNWCNDAILKFVLENNYSIILLHRQNMLKVQLSKELAKQTGIWGKKEKDAVNASKEYELQPIDIEFIKQKLNSYKNDVAKYQKRFSNGEFKFIEITFEDIFGDDKSFEDRLDKVAEICHFLDIETSALNADNEKLYQQLVNNKQNTAQDYAGIPNIEAIKAEFSEYAL